MHGLSSAQHFLFWGHKEDCVTVDQGVNDEKFCKISTHVVMNVKHTL
jgi:hypothetical protein